MRDARAINDKVRLLAKLGAALIEARESGADLQAARRGCDRLGQAGAAASKRQNAWRARTKRISRLLRRAPGRCCIGWGRCSSDRLQLPRRAQPPLRTLRAVELVALDLRKRRRPEMAEQLADELSPPSLARSRAERRRCRAPDLGGGHPAGIARPAARRRHLGRGQPAMARRRRPADPARPVHRDARGRAAARRRAGNRRRSISPSGAPCWTGAFPKWRPKPRQTGWRTSDQRR